MRSSRPLLARLWKGELMTTKLEKHMKESGFQKFGLKKELIEALAKHDIVEPTKVQEEVIPIVLDHRDVLCMSETGSGKTISFALPIISQLEPKGGARVLVVAPTRELAKQIAGEFRKFARHKGLQIVTIYGGVSMGPQIDKIPDADIVVGTPGRILDLHRQGHLKLDMVKHLVLDECDRMFDMGFIEDVEAIIYSTPPSRQVLLFSATVGSKIKDISSKYMKDPQYVRVQPHLVRGVLDQSYYVVAHNQKISLLAHLLKDIGKDLTIIFCRTKRTADMVSRALKQNGHNADSLHGDMSQARREKVVEKFSNRELTVVVATDVAARGLHIDDVRYVINYNLPEDTETYIHRVGRTARNGNPGDAINLLDDNDFRLFDPIMSHYEGKIKKKVAEGVERVMFRKDGDSRRHTGRNDRRYNNDNRRGARSSRTFSTGSDRPRSAKKQSGPAPGTRQYDPMALADLD